MSIALGLLISAMQLLTLVQANPNLPQSFRDEVEVIAKHAIVVAKEEIAKAQVPQPQVQTQVVVQEVAPVTPSVPIGAPVVSQQVVVASPVSIWGTTGTVTVTGKNCETVGVEGRVRYSDGSVKMEEGIAVTFDDGSVVTLQPNKENIYKFYPQKSQTITVGKYGMTNSINIVVPEGVTCN